MSIERLGSIVLYRDDNDLALNNRRMISNYNHRGHFEVLPKIFDNLVSL